MNVQLTLNLKKNRRYAYSDFLAGRMSHIIIDMYTAQQSDSVMDERYAPYRKIVYVIYCPINRTKRFDIL